MDRDGRARCGTLIASAVMPVESRPGAVRLHVYVQPRGSRTEAVGRHGDLLKVRVAAPPVDGAANETLVRWLARELGVAAGAVRLAAGASSRTKVVEIAGVDAAKVEAWIRASVR